MELKVKQLADLVGGDLFGDAEAKIYSLAKIEEAKEGDLTFLANPAYEKYFSSCNATAIIVKKGFDKTKKKTNYIEVENPAEAFLKVIYAFFNPKFELKGIAKSAVIDSTAIIGNNVALGENVVIGKNCKIGDNTKIYHNTVIYDNVQIGSNCLIFSNVSIRENCVIGSNVILHSGVVIGADGFGFAKNADGTYLKIPQIGNVIIEDDVEIGANSAIDRAALGSTIIKKGVKIDNLVQVGHNCYIGENTVISGQVGIAGSSKIGKNCMLAGQVGIAGHLEIADNTVIGAQSGIAKSILKSGMYLGSPAKEHKTFAKLEAHFRNLENYANKIDELEKKLKELEVLLTKAKG